MNGGPTNDRKQPELEVLMQRFDAGDRSSELLARLNRAAFDCFHAPWESYQDPRHLQADGIPSTTQGPLPMEDEECEGDSVRDRLNTPRLFQSDPPPPPAQPFQGHLLPESNEEASSNPLEQLVTALDFMGLMPHLAPGRGLVVELDHDPRPDNQSMLAFRADWEGKCLQMICRGNLSLAGLSERELEQICRAHNRLATGLEAKTYRPREGAQLQLRLITKIPFDLTQSGEALLEHLASLCREERKFWRQVRRHRPA